ncbi:MipA/OmpV family protein [Sphingomonas sp. JC676]|uniref:MipA/OmpV family protein n=1 Tax=Sphingomonas sp. JC676 TaxID=2768065 RepID=UPI001657DDEE|nr:MipA/OmpV family protein [Sphingomonas sp. JC676]MBC9032447.1 MipA/OmpV family protein [Sphingomonas sp. JC676]
MLRPLLAAAALPCVFFATSAAAQTGDSETREAKEPRRIRVALGPQFVPAYPGADNLSLSPLVDVAVARGNEPFDFEAADESFGFPVLKTGGFSFGPAFNFQTGRKRNESHIGIDEVGTTIELGGFAQYWIAPKLRVHAEVRQGVNGHKALVSNIGLDYVARDADRWLFALGPRVSLSNAKYQDAWFSVSPREAAATGLPAFEPDGGGVHAVGANATGLYQLTPRWGLYGFAKYDRLVGDAARSPIAQGIGSRNQVSGGLGLSFTFGRDVGRR